MQTILKKIKTITSHTGHARYLAECDESPIFWLVNSDEIPRDKFSYSCTVQVLRHHTSRGSEAVIIRETSHKRYEVFAVIEGQTYPTDEAAESEYSRQSRMTQNTKGFSA